VFVGWKPLEIAVFDAVVVYNDNDGEMGRRDIEIILTLRNGGTITERQNHRVIKTC